MIKKSLPNIEKLTKTVVVATIMSVFFISGLMLCCEIGLLPPKIFKSKISSCCVSTKADHFKNHHPDTCLCCQLSKSKPDRIHENFELVKQSQHDLFTSVPDDSSSRIRHQVALVVSSQGPPRAPTIPIYLQFSVLRL